MRIEAPGTSDRARTVARRIRGILATLCLAACASVALADPAWPARPVRIVVGFGAGGVADVLGRYLAEKLSGYNGQSFVVENRPGAGGNIGAGAVAAAAPDGHQLMVAPGSVLSMNPSLYAKVPFGDASFAPVSLVADMAVVLVVPAKHPATTLQQLVEQARREPGRLVFPSPGAGSSLHLATELFQRTAGVSLLHVPYKSGAEAATALLSGQATGMFTNPPVVMAQIRAGSLRALAVAGARRLPQLPEVPTTAEAGLPGFDVSSWFALVAPAQTPRPIVDRLGEQVARALREPDVQRLLDLGVRPVGSSPDALAAFLVEDRRRWDEVIRAAGIRLD
jgi:tripartite-type tricarboxylate transporter receptor subunit TctC